MTDKPFRTMPALLLSVPGILLLLGAVSSLVLLYTGRLESSNHMVSDLAVVIIGAGLLLVPAVLIATPIALYYTTSRSGSGSRKTGFIILNALLLVVALVCIPALFVAATTVFFNPG